jgi:hypothetical protein
MLSSIALSVLLYPTQLSLRPIQLQLTPEQVASSIELLAKDSFSRSSSVTFTTDFRSKLGAELIRLNGASEKTIQKVGDVLLRPTDELADRKLLFCRLLFLLRYILPSRTNGYTSEDFYTYHQDLVIPINFDESDEYKDYPTPTDHNMLTISPRDFYDWPWIKTSRGWRLRWFTYRLDSGMQSYEYMYELFSKLPRRRGVGEGFD